MSRACEFLVGPKPIPFLRNLISCMLLIFPTDNVVMYYLRQLSVKLVPSFATIR